MSKTFMFHKTLPKKSMKLYLLIVVIYSIDFPGERDFNAVVVSSPTAKASKTMHAKCFRTVSTAGQQQIQ